MNVTMDQVKDVFDGVRDSFKVSRVFGGVSKPAGAFVFKGGDVRWVPIVNRDLAAVLRAAILALSLLTARSIVREVFARR